MPTGGRRSTTWTKGQGGKPKGAKDTVPRSQKASIVAIMREIVEEKPEAIKAALERGLTAAAPRSFAYLSLAAAYFDGKPADNVNVKGDFTISWKE